MSEWRVPAAAGRIKGGAATALTGGAALVLTLLIGATGSAGFLVMRGLAPLSL